MGDGEDDTTLAVSALVIAPPWAVGTARQHAALVGSAAAGEKRMLDRSLPVTSRCSFKI